MDLMACGYSLMAPGRKKTPGVRYPARRGAVITGSPRPAVSPSQ
jgi:hypothetical protein